MEHVQSVYHVTLWSQVNDEFILSKLCARQGRIILIVYFIYR